MINGALCWHLHWFIYGSLIEVKRRLVGAAGGGSARPPWLCLRATHRLRGGGGSERAREREREKELGIPLSLLSVSCLLWRERETSHSSEMDEERKGKTSMRSQLPPFPAVSLTFHFIHKNPRRGTLVCCNKWEMLILNRQSENWMHVYI